MQMQSTNPKIPFGYLSPEGKAAIAARAAELAERRKAIAGVQTQPKK